MTTKKELDEIFDESFVQPLRDLVNTIQNLPEGKVDSPLALLEMRLRYALEAYDAARESYTCPKCGRTSYNPNDIANKYCGYCHEFERTE